MSKPDDGRMATFVCTDEAGELVEVPMYSDKNLYYEGQKFRYLSEVGDYLGSSLSIETVESHVEAD